MSLKLLIPVVCICAVRAYLIKELDSYVGVLDVPSRNCYPRECEQQCSRLGFPGGACVNGRCICDNFQNDQSTELYVQFTADIIDDEHDTKILASSGSCYLSECEQRCRRLGFPGGACVNGRCKCDNFRNDQSAELDVQFTPDIIDDEHDTKILASSNSCYLSECEQRCRRLGFPGGACVNGRCKCDIFRNEQSAKLDVQFTPDIIDVEHGTKILASSGSCYLSECEQRCCRLGFPGGACVNGRCKCDNFRNDQSAELDVQFTPDIIDDEHDNKILASSNSCYLSECEQRCRRLGFPGGACVNGRRKCDNFRNDQSGELDVQFTPDIIDVEHDTNILASSGSCYLSECEQRCRRLGFPGGACVNGLCKCDNFSGLTSSFRCPT